MARKVPRYSDEIKQDALAMLRDGKKMEEVAAAVGVSVPTLYHWKRAAGLIRERKPRANASGPTDWQGLLDLYKEKQRQAAALQSEIEAIEERLVRRLEG